MKKIKGIAYISRILLLSAVMMLFAGTVYADEWTHKGSKTYYSYEDENGKTVNAKGLQVIKGKTYYFNKKGVMQTGWVAFEEGLRYFRAQGNEGVKGSMMKGFRKFSGKKYYFNKKTGIQETGLIQVGNYTYYFKATKDKTPGVYGAAVVKKFATWKKSRYYFDKDGRMVTSQWVGNYYLGADGKKLVSTVTPDSYLVDSKGKRVRKVSTGLVDIDGTLYYWSASKKKFLKNTTKTNDDVVYVIDSDGVVTAKSGTIPSGAGKAKILIVAGHGQGDTGAVGIGQEYLKTREFAKLIYNQLSVSGKVQVDYLKNGSTAYDLYQRNAASLKGITITGTGSSKKTLTKRIKSNSNLPKLYNYDYVLEVHFNATAVSSKDLRGNGSYKGFGFYVNQYKKSITLESSICSKIRTLGFKVWSSGVHRSSGLYNARICQELGVPYALVETAFIDDADDMRFYNKKKKAMAKAVADAIVSFYG